MSSRSQQQKSASIKFNLSLSRARRRRVARIKIAELSRRARAQAAAARAQTSEARAGAVAFTSSSHSLPLSRRSEHIANSTGGPHIIIYSPPIPTPLTKGCSNKSTRKTETTGKHHAHRQHRRRSTPFRPPLLSALFIIICTSVNPIATYQLTSESSNYKTKLEGTSSVRALQGANCVPSISTAAAADKVQQQRPVGLSDGSLDKGTRAAVSAVQAPPLSGTKNGNEEDGQERRRQHDNYLFSATTSPHGSKALAGQNNSSYYSHFQQHYFSHSHNQRQQKPRTEQKETTVGRPILTANDRRLAERNRQHHKEPTAGGDYLAASASMASRQATTNSMTGKRESQSPTLRRLHKNGQQRVAPISKQTGASGTTMTAAHRQAPSSSRPPLAHSGGFNGDYKAPLSGESQWIPIVTNDNNERANRINRPPVVDTRPANHGHGLASAAATATQAASSNQTSSALLDLPVALPLPLPLPLPPPPPPRQAQNSHHQLELSGQSVVGGGADQALGRPRELQLAAGSHVHGRQHHRHRHRHHLSNHYDFERRPAGTSWHLHVYPAEPRPSHNRRRPRLHQASHEPFVNSIEHELELPAGKLFKRVLLCDKTLVSLDYIRHLEAEPRPGGQFLDEHEINEINDNFISDFEGANYELLARSSAEQPTLSNLQSGTSDMASSQLDYNATLLKNNHNNSKAQVGELAEGERHLATAATTTAGQQRRAAVSLLSDDEPLVRCDMWDLEKGLKSRKPPEGILRMAVKADFDTVRDAINRCRQLSERTLPPDEEARDGLEIMSSEDLAGLFSMKRGLIPGTKWCGLGDQASSYNDLGQKHRIDICCRAHDHCPIRSKPFRNDYGVLNIGLYTKSHCDCDADFYRCLRGVRSRTADMLGNLYFNVMKLQCMREERLKVCRELRPIALGFERCVRYEESPLKTVFKFTTPPVAY